jgi:tRNA threonylcarbamoyladenosine biosynthesis protein TsaB
MLTLSLRTDKPDAEIGLFQDTKELAYVSWRADRQLAETIHEQLRTILVANNYDIHDLQAIAVFQGPGSFTGLRIGISVANALADSLAVPIVASSGDAWIPQAQRLLAQDENQHIVIPEYGSPPHITQPKK